MRDPFESLIPLNGCKGTTFFAHLQIFSQENNLFRLTKPISFPLAALSAHASPPSTVCRSATLTPAHPTDNNRPQ